MKDKKIVIIGAVVVLAIVIAIVAIVLRKGEAEQQVSEWDAIDTVGDFYNQWLEAVKNPDTAVPDRETLANSPILSKTLRDRLVSEYNNPDISPDPVLCQTVVPERIGIRHIFETEEEAQILITARGGETTEQAIFTLLKYNNGWYINTIECSPGEIAPEREFSFESDGFLLKDSIPSPYNKENWHLVFEQGGVMGHVVPLFFDAGSECKSKDGNTSVCNPSQFTEATKVYVRGQMSELGVTVKFQDFLE